MALRRRNSTYYAYYSLFGKRHEVSLGDITPDEAKSLERSIMAAARAQRNAQRAQRLLGGIVAPSAPQIAADARITPQTAAYNGITLAALFDIASKRRELGKEHQSTWQHFCEAMGDVPPHAITPRQAQIYLDNRYGDKSAKTYNNALCQLKQVFNLSLVEAGLQSSPLAALMPRKKGNVLHYRGFTADEIARIFGNLKQFSSYWYCLAKIAYYTGLRLESCQRLAPCNVEGGVITIMPSKTARFGRAVKIPILPPLAEYLREIAPKDANTPYCNQYEFVRDWGSTGITFFSGYLKSVGIEDTDEGKASFHSFRVTFVSLLSAAGVSQDIIRGIVGHADAQTTDLYNHDTSAAIAAFKNISFG